MSVANCLGIVGGGGTLERSWLAGDGGATETLEISYKLQVTRDKTSWN